VCYSSSNFFSLFLSLYRKVKEDFCFVFHHLFGNSFFSTKNLIRENRSFFFKFQNNTLYIYIYNNGGSIDDDDVFYFFKILDFSNICLRLLLSFFLSLSLYCFCSPFELQRREEKRN